MSMISDLRLDKMFFSHGYGLEVLLYMSMFSDLRQDIMFLRLIIVMTMV